MMIPPDLATAYVDATGRDHASGAVVFAHRILRDNDSDLTVRNIVLETNEWPRAKNMLGLVKENVGMARLKGGVFALRVKAEHYVAALSKLPQDELRTTKVDFLPTGAERFPSQLGM